MTHVCTLHPILVYIPLLTFAHCTIILCTAHDPPLHTAPYLNVEQCSEVRTTAECRAGHVQVVDIQPEVVVPRGAGTPPEHTNLNVDTGDLALFSTLSYWLWQTTRHLIHH